MVIDLGEMGHPGRPGADERLGDRRWFATSTRRAIAIVLVTVACLGAPSTSARVTEHWTEPMWTSYAGVSSFSVGPDQVLAFVNEGRQAIALDLHTGELRWRVAVRRTAVGIFDLGRGVVAVLSRRVRRGSGGIGTWATVTTTLLDSARGDVTGTVSGVPLGWTPSGQLLMLDRRVFADGRPCVAPQPECWVLSAVHERTGDPLWRVRAEGVLTPSAVGDQRELEAVRTVLAVATTGELAVHDAASGAELGRFRLPGGGSALDLDGRLSVIGDAVVSAEPVGLGVRVSRYPFAPKGVAEARAAWTGLVPPAAGDGPRPPTTGAVYGCGVLLCLDLDDRDAVIEPATGAVRAVVTGQIAGYLGGGHLLTTQSQPLPDSPSDYRQAVQVVDQRGGATLAVFYGSAVVPWPDAGGRALLAQQGEEIVGFTVLDQDGRPEPLGSVPGANLSCQAYAGLLACTDPLGRLRVWRLPELGRVAASG